MLISEREFNDKYKKEHERFLNESEFYVSNPEKLREDIAEKSPPGLNINNLPVPRPDEFSYCIMRYQGFLRYPKRLKNYVVAKHEKWDNKRSFLPTILDIEPSSRCNFRCIMCQLSDWHNGKRADDLTLNDFKRLLDSQYGLTEVKLQGMGEPLLNKDFFEMVRLLRERLIWIRTTINGSLVHVNENYMKLIDCGVNEIQISFDGANKEIFERIRKNSKFDQVVENLKLLNQYANSKKLYVTSMWVLVQEHNIHQIFDFIDLAHYMEFKRLTFNMGLSDFGQEKWRETNQALQIKQTISHNTAERLMQKGRKKDISITFWDLSKKYSLEDDETKCPWPFTRAYVSSDMKVVPCCMIGNPDVANLGDANNFNEIWNGEIFKGFRRAHLEGKIPQFCRNCYEL